MAGYLVKLGVKYLQGFSGADRWTTNPVLALSFHDRDAAEWHASRINAMGLGNTRATVEVGGATEEEQFQSRLKRLPMWAREWMEYLRQRIAQRRQRESYWRGESQGELFHPRIKGNEPSLEQILSLPGWTQDEIFELEFDGK